MEHVGRYRDYLVGRCADYATDLQTWDPVVVPPDSFFALEDSRDASYDCRYYGFLRLQHLLASIRDLSASIQGCGSAWVTGALGPNRPEAFERSRVSGECEELH